MKTIDFIPILATDRNGVSAIRYVNLIHIKQIFETAGVINIELTEYEILEAHNQNINVFMDQFIR